MAMSKQDFIALADAIKAHNAHVSGCFDGCAPFENEHLEALVTFCKSQNSNFMAGRWLGYIAGENGKNGGAIKA